MCKGTETRHMKATIFGRVSRSEGCLHNTLVQGCVIAQAPYCSWWSPAEGGPCPPSQAHLSSQPWPRLLLFVPGLPREGSTSGLLHILLLISRTFFPIYFHGQSLLYPQVLPPQEDYPWPLSLMQVPCYSPHSIYHEECIMTCNYFTCHHVFYLLLWKVA